MLFLFLFSNFIKVTYVETADAQLKIMKKIWPFVYIQYQVRKYHQLKWMQFSCLIPTLLKL